MMRAAPPMMMITCSSLLLVRRSILLLLLICASTDASTSSTGSNLHDWIKARCGPEGHSIWVYEGSLSDPLTGKQIARVEGVEVVRLWGKSRKEDILSQQDHLKRCLPLTAAKRIPKADASATIVTRKLFCYRPLLHDEDSDNDNDGLLRQIRLRPNSPVRKIPMDQAVSVYDSATTFFETKHQSHFWHVHTQGKAGHASLWTRAVLENADDMDSRSSSSSSSSKTFGETSFTIFARPQTKLQQERAAPELDNNNNKNDDNNNKSKKTPSSPTRSSLIQFGASPDQEKSKYGARETYQYSYPANKWPPECRVRYTRYGEGPVWYGPGRFCTLELHGRRIVQQQPQQHHHHQSPLQEHQDSLPAKVIAQALPTFWSAPAPTNPMEAAKELETLLQKEHQQHATLVWKDSDDDPSLWTWQERVGKRAGKWMERLREASWMAS